MFLLVVSSPLSIAKSPDRIIPPKAEKMKKIIFLCIILFTIHFFIFSYQSGGSGD